MFNSTYAEILNSCVQDSYRSFKPLTSSKLNWEGSNEDINLGVLCDSILRYSGEIISYKTISCIIGQYQLTVHRNQLSIYSLTDNKEVLQASYGAATRTMKVLNTNVTLTDINNLKELINKLCVNQKLNQNIQVQRKELKKQPNLSGYMVNQKVKKQANLSGCMVNQRVKKQANLSGCMVNQRVKKQANLSDCMVNQRVKKQPNFNFGSYKNNLQFV